MDVVAGFHGAGLGGWAELVSALQNIGQHYNWFVCYSQFLGSHHFLKLNSVDRRVMRRQIMHGGMSCWRLKAKLETKGMLLLIAVAGALYAPPPHQFPVGTVLSVKNSFKCIGFAGKRWSIFGQDRLPGDCRVHTPFTHDILSLRSTCTRR